MKSRRNAAKVILALFIVQFFITGPACAVGEIKLWLGPSPYEDRGKVIISDRTLGHEHQDPVITDGSNEAIVIWIDSRRRSRSDIYAQKLNAGGDRLWAASGVWIASGEPGSKPTYEVGTISSNRDGHDGAVLIWDNYLSFFTREVRAMRVDPEGNKLWTPPNGRIIAWRPNASLSAQPKVVWSPDGDYFMFFLTRGLDSGGLSYDIMAQKVRLSNGELMWPAGNPSTEGKIVCDYDRAQGGPVAVPVPDPDGGAICVWRDYRSGAESNIYANRININGNLLWPPGNPGKAGLPVFLNITTPLLDIAAVPDGQGGVIVVAYNSTTANEITGHIYAQRINKEGQRLWGSQGKLIRQPYYALMRGEVSLDAKPDGFGGAIIAWADRRASVDGPSREFKITAAQRIDSSGNVLWPASNPTTEGITLEAPIESDLWWKSVIPDEKGGAIIIWILYRGALYNKIVAQRVNANGEIEWPYGAPDLVGYDVSYPPDNIYTFGTDNRFIGSDGVGGAVMGLQTTPLKFNPPDDIYGQRIMGDFYPPQITISAPSSSDAHYFAPTNAFYWKSGVSPIFIQWSSFDPKPTENSLPNSPATASYTTDEANYIVPSGWANKDASDIVSWTTPQGETTMGAIRVEVMDNAGSINTLGGPNTGEAEILFQTDNTSPTVESVSPTNESQASSYTQPMIVRFIDSSPMNKTAVQNAIKIYPPLQNLTYLWSDNDSNVAIWHSPFSPVTTYEVTIEATASDLAGNTLASPFTWRFRSPPYLGDPLIDRVTFDGRKYFALSGYGAAYERDTVTASPKIGFRISSAAGISTESITLAIDEPFGAFYYIPSSYFAFTAGSTTEGFVTDFPINLSPANHILRIRAKNNDGIEGISQDIKVRVYGGRVQLVPGTEILTLPSPFKPLTGTEPLTVSYVLTTNANISVFIYNTGGQVILKKNFKSASQGGRAGYNSFQWNGVTDFGRRPGNGIYVIKIASGNRSVGTGKLVVFE